MTHSLVSLYGKEFPLVDDVSVDIIEKNWNVCPSYCCQKPFVIPKGTIIIFTYARYGKDYHFLIKETKQKFIVLEDELCEMDINPIYD
jgi:hypothetical protein